MTTEVIEPLAQWTRSASLVAVFSGCEGEPELQDLGANKGTDLILWGNEMVLCVPGSPGPQRCLLHASELQ